MKDHVVEADLQYSRVGLRSAHFPQAHGTDPVVVYVLRLLLLLCAEKEKELSVSRQLLSEVYTANRIWTTSR